MIWLKDKRTWILLGFYGVLAILFHMFWLKLGGGDDYYFMTCLDDTSFGAFMVKRWYGWSSRLVIEGVLVLVLQQLDGNVIGPKILGKTTKLASFWVMFAIIVGGGLFGLPGMILGVPVFAIIYAYTSGAINSKLREKEMPTDTLVYEDFSKYHIDKEEIFGKERFEAARRLGERDTKPAQRE